MRRFLKTRTVAAVLVGTLLTTEVPVFGEEGATAPIVDAAPLTGPELLAIAAPMRSFRPRDAFDVAPAVNLTGRRFVVELPVVASGGGGCISLPFWQYSVESKELTVTFFGGRRVNSSMKGYDGKYHPILSKMQSYAVTTPVKCSSVSKGSSRLTNAFGVSTTVKRVEETVVEILAMRPPLASDRYHFLMASFPVEPENARTITKTLRLKYEGRLTDWGNGSTLACGTQHWAPDMKSVWDTTVDTCIYKGVIERVSVFDAATGAVLIDEEIVWFDFTGRNKVDF